ncbi:alkylphosphonate utilization protein [Paenibacillus ferrarius]|uniref:Alkylphosphonate utilization protein n=1 Tax=Paenibacillus ferrarius TaxID=1469647 RepID=A0A1V4HH76_9BACL|nr:alkylphosphonate utilization protein [Paenibacillus ferrarius]OPH53527.1 alkylphosphonate utilization protein [Paenibacillus ferrarius]
MADFPNCPQCNSEYTYEDGGIFICPECSHEWSQESETEKSEDNKIIKDSNGNVLSDGDHDIDCKIDGFGAMKLKFEFVKKV